jgi:hypothetical protein
MRTVCLESMFIQRRMELIWCHDEPLLRFQMNMTDATAQVMAPNARYRFKLSYGSSSCLGSAVEGRVALSASYKQLVFTLENALC